MLKTIIRQLKKKKRKKKKNSKDKLKRFWVGLDSGTK